MTFGQRLKKYRKINDLTQQELAEMIGVSTQAVSKWETDSGMPDISQIVPLTRVLGVSADLLLGVVDENDNEEFEEVYRKCMELENVNCAAWPPEASKAEQGFGMMYDYFFAHPNSVRAAKYLLDIAEIYWGKLSCFENEDQAVMECERFANCIFRYSDDADYLAEARYLIACIWTRAGQKGRAEEMLAKMPFRYGDRCYWSAEVAQIAGDVEKAEELCKESFTHRARFISRCIRLVAGLPNKSMREKLEYREYMLRIINAFLSGGDYMPHRQVYQKLALVSSMISQHFSVGNTERAVECFEELVQTTEDYVAFVRGGCKGTTLLLLEDDQKRHEAVWENSHVYGMVDRYLKKSMRACEGVESTERLERCIARARALEELISEL